jgi:hypothetical protein
VTPPVTEDELAEWERLCREATAAIGGEWFDDSYGNVHSVRLNAEYQRIEDTIPDDAPDSAYGILPDTAVCSPGDVHLSNAATRFIARSNPQSVADLIAAYREAVDELTIARRIVQRVMPDALGASPSWPRLPQPRSPQ